MKPALLVLMLVGPFLSQSDWPTGVSVAGRSMSADSCNSPDAPIGCCFVNMPPTLTTVARLAGQQEPGERLVIRGRILTPEGGPYPGVVLYVYHTDHRGLYSRAGGETGVQRWQGHLHGWCRTDNAGRYELQTIRPAPYPDNSVPAHIHPVVKEPGNKRPYYLTDFVFRDDALVTPAYFRSLSRWNYVGGTGVVELTKDQAGVWRGNRDIRLRAE